MTTDVSFNTLYDQPIEDKTEHLSDLPKEKREVIEATQELARSIPALPLEEEREISFEAQSLVKEPPLSDEEFNKGVENLLQAVKEHHGGRPVEEKTEEEGNYIIKIRNLVIRILEQLGKSADEKDRAQINEGKQNYRRLTRQEADLIEKIGKAGFVFSALALGCMFGQFLPFFNTADRGIMRFLSEHSVPPLGRMFTGQMEARQREANAASQLIYTELSNIMGKAQTESGNKQEVIQLLQSLLDGLRKATAPGG